MQKPAHNRKDLTGMRIGRIVVVEPSRTEGKNVYWKCKCDCGTEFETRAVCLTRSRPTSSCGCKRKDTISALRWKGYQDISLNYFTSLKRGAETRNLEFSITIEYMWNLFIEQNKMCSLSGFPIDFDRDLKSRRQTASLDRKDSSKGYVEGNVQWVHKSINKMKGNMSDEEFINLCTFVAQQKSPCLQKNTTNN